MNGWNKVLTIANDWQFNWVLDPCLLEVVVKGALAVTIANT